MNKMIYRFEIVDNNGKTLKEEICQCTNVRAERMVHELLKKSEMATSVFGFESNGHSVHSAYRG